MTSEEIKHLIKNVPPSVAIQSPQVLPLYEIAYQLAVGNEQRQDQKEQAIHDALARGVADGRNERLADDPVRAGSGSEVRYRLALAEARTADERTTPPNPQTSSIQSQSLPGAEIDNAEYFAAQLDREKRTEKP